SEVALGEGHHGLLRDEGEVGGGEGEGPVDLRLGLGVAAQPEQRERGAPRGVGRAGIEGTCLGEIPEPRVPVAEALLSQGRRHEQLDVVGRQLESGLDRHERLPAVQRYVPIVVAQRQRSTRLNSSHEWISYAVFCLKKK